MNRIKKTKLLILVIIGIILLPIVLISIAVEIGTRIGNMRISYFGDKKLSKKELINKLNEINKNLQEGNNGTYN